MNPGRDLFAFWRLVLLAAMAGGLLWLSSGCGGRESRVEEGLHGQILHLSVGAEPRSLDPHMVTGVAEYQVILMLYEGLVAHGPDPANPTVPGVASHWEVSGDGLRWDFHLSEKARWSNGDRVTAQDFVRAYRRVLDRRVGSPQSEMLFLLSGASACYESEEPDWDQLGARAEGEHHLILKLEEPIPYFLEVLKHPAWLPLHRLTLEQKGESPGRNMPWARDGQFISNGPFLLRDWQAGSRLRLDRNPHYWDASTVRLNGVVVYPIQNVHSVERAFRGGQLHITHDVPFQSRDSYRRGHHPEYREQEQLATTYLLFNTRSGVLNDPRVRQALSLAIDREAITENIVRAGQPAFAFTPSDLPGYPVPTLVGFDPDKARTLLEEAGYPGGDGFPELEYATSTAETARAVAEAIQQMWHQHLGIQVRLHNSEFRVYLDTLNRGRFDIGYLAWYGDFADPYSFLNVFRTGSPLNRPQWEGDGYDEFLDRSNRTPNRDDRLHLLAEAERILLEDAPIAPIYWVTNPRLVHPFVHGWAPSLLDIHPIRYVYLRQP